MKRESPRDAEKLAYYTPGPWITDDVYKDDIARYVMSEFRPFPHTIARLELGQERQTQEANARLMAAAPELLEALKSLLAWAQHVHGPGPVYINYAVMDVARDAIAKAEEKNHE
jgi:hypothetical protein